MGKDAKKPIWYRWDGNLADNTVGCAPLVAKIHSSYGHLRLATGSNKIARQSVTNQYWINPVTMFFALPGDVAFKHTTSAKTYDDERNNLVNSTYKKELR